ncbi:MAG: hypothetical protein U5J96_04120 [Ignavibacteriaceae bacterium]|nr:hypothetical protein [Ignavibacteriaceae bacterium]
MKNLFVSLVTISVLFVIGCQENSITDPVANESANKVQAVTPDTYFHGVIPLESVLKDPYPVGNSFYRINGQIEYDFRILYADPIPPSPQRYASLYFETNADLQYFCTVCSPSVEDELSGFIAEVSEDFVPLGGNFVSLLEKTYAIQGREDGMVLKVRFAVTSDRIELNAMWLALPNSNTTATEINHY